LTPPFYGGKGARRSCKGLGFGAAIQVAATRDELGATSLMPTAAIVV
jgi:hypothetical protein